jgi:creatinine amidohydrolase
MRRLLTVVCLGLAAAIAAPMLAQQKERGIRLEDEAWPDVEAHLRPDMVVVIPLGAAAKEHGPHLKLRSDYILADYFARRVLDATAVVVAPPLAYHYYPAFVEYPGSTSLSLETARDLTVDVVRSLARHGARRFYVLNTGLTTARPLQAAARVVANEGILLWSTDFAGALDAVAAPLRQQAAGSHADEIETSLMLHIAPDAVEMSRAVRNLGSPPQPFRLTRRQGGDGLYSPSGVFGDPTLATAAKGAAMAEGILKMVLDDINRLRKEPLPAANAPATAAPPRFGNSNPLAQPLDNCTEGDLRALRAVGDAYTYYWSIGDAELLGGLWAPKGDIIHPDGNIERTPQMIVANRRDLFARREYRGSKHPMTLTMIRCINSEIAVADGRWSLNGVRDTNGKELPLYEGLATMTMRRIDGVWRIEAYRYTMKAAETAMPTWLKRPGWPDKK